MSAVSVGGRAVAGWRPQSLLGRARGTLHGFTDWLGVWCLVVFLALATVGQLVAGSPYALDEPGAVPPSAAHWMGTDNLGRDLFARTADGAWTSLLIGLGSVALGLLLSVPLGITAGYYHGKRVDELIMRALEVFQALPTIILGMFVLMLLGNGPMHIGPVSVNMAARLVLCIGISFVPFFARILRSATIVEMQEDYVACLKVLGVRPRNVILGEVSVNVLPQLLPQATLGMAVAIFAEGGLSFLGLGVQPPQPTLGNLIGQAGGQFLDGSWWYALFPGLVMVIAILGFNLVGDAFNDALIGTRNRAGGQRAGE